MGRLNGASASPSTSGPADPAVQRLTGYGLRLASQLPVPGAVADDIDAPPDVTIVQDAPARPGAGPVYAATPDGLRFTCPGVASYHIVADRIAVVPDPEAAPGMVSGMLVATALPALLWLRGRFVLHAAAAQLPGGGALAIAGGTGSGKSTILAQLIGAGAALIGDDTIAFDPATGRHASGLAGGWFLGEAADGGRRFVAVDPARALTSAAIGAILVLDRPQAIEGGMDRLDPVAAVTHLLASVHRPRVPAVLGRAGATLRHATLLARQIPLYSWRRRVGAETLTPTEWTMLDRLGTERQIE